MKLRSGTQTQVPVVQEFVYVSSWPKSVKEFTPEFFDDSSKAWRSNKKEVAKGIYKYKSEAQVRRSSRVAASTTAKQEVQVRRSSRLATK